MCLSLGLRRHTLAWLVGERLWDKDERSNSGFHPSSPTWSLFNFSYCIILKLCIFMPKTFFSLPSEVFHPYWWCASRVLQKVVECQVGVFDQVCAVFTATAWSSSCLGNFEPCLHPQCAVVLNVCSHNGPQCPLLFLCGSFLCKPPQPLIHWHSTTWRPRHWHCKCTTWRAAPASARWHLWSAAACPTQCQARVSVPVTPNKKMTRWREWEGTLLGIDGHFSNMESRSRPKLGWERERQ